MADDVSTTDASNESYRTVCYVAALDGEHSQLFATNSAVEWEAEHQHNATLDAFIEQSRALKKSFMKESHNYGLLKADLSRPAAFYDHLYRILHDNSSAVLATVDVNNLPQYTLVDVQAHVRSDKSHQREFFVSYARRVKVIHEQFQRLAEENNTLILELKRFLSTAEEDQYIARVDELIHSHNNLGLLIAELDEELQAFLESRLVTQYWS